MKNKRLKCIFMTFVLIFLTAGITVLDAGCKKENFVNIMTYNIQSAINSGKEEQVENDYAAFARVINTYEADIVGLNEVWDEGTGDPMMIYKHKEPQVKKLSEASGLQYFKFAEAFSLDYGKYGNGILSKFAIKNFEVIPIPIPEGKVGKKGEGGSYESRCLLKATLENGLTVLVTHFGVNADEQQNAAEIVLNNITKKKCVLMGDFNVAPDSGILKKIRKKMKDTADLFEKELLSCPADNPTEKLDYIFVSKDMDIISADIPDEVVSDHRPVIARIAF